MHSHEKDPHRANIPVHYSPKVYDRYTQSFLGRFDRLLVDRLLHESRAKPSCHRILDVGCGTSRFLIRLATNAVLKKAQFFGLDYYAPMIELSRNNIGDELLRERIMLIQGDVHCLPCRSGSMDFVISRSTLHHWADPVAALVEVRRVLASDGVALIHEIRRDPDPAVLALFNRFRAEAGVEPTRLEEKYTAEQIHKIVTASGLSSETKIFAPARGYSSLGCEIRIAASR